MNKQSKLIISCFALFMAFSLLVFGVYAAQIANYTAVNSVTYEIKDVFCSIYGSITGGDLTGANTTFQSQETPWYSGSNMSTTQQVWTIGNFKFDKDNPTENIEVAITIQNKSNQPIYLRQTFQNKSLYPDYFDTQANIRVNALVRYSTQTATATSSGGVTSARVNMPEETNYIVNERNTPGDIRVVYLTFTLKSDFDSFSDLSFGWNIVIGLVN